MTLDQDEFHSQAHKILLLYIRSSKIDDTTSSFRKKSPLIILLNNVCKTELWLANIRYHFLRDRQSVRRNIKSKIEKTAIHQIKVFKDSFH